MADAPQPWMRCDPAVWRPGGFVCFEQPRAVKLVATRGAAPENAPSRKSTELLCRWHLYYLKAPPAPMAPVAPKAFLSGKVAEDLRAEETYLENRRKLQEDLRKAEIGRGHV